MQISTLLRANGLGPARAIRPHLERLPASPGSRDLGAGLLRGDGLASHALRALRDRGRFPSSAHPRRHQEARLEMGHAAGAKPCSGERLKASGSSSATGFPRSPVRSTRRSAPRAWRIIETSVRAWRASAFAKRCPDGSDRVPGLDVGLGPAPSGSGSFGPSPLTSTPEDRMLHRCPPGSGRGFGPVTS
jgi:hypothetical protein